jgi:hypothetical protein
MVKIMKISNGHIIDILKVMLGNILIELYINIEYMDQKCFLHLSITEDAETISAIINYNKWITINEINYTDYQVINIDSNDALFNLIYNKIVKIQFGIGETLINQEKVVYYLKIKTNKLDFLFFNNGDYGAYSFDNIDNILANDIYGFSWSEDLSVINNVRNSSSPSSQ